MSVDTTHMQGGAIRHRALGGEVACDLIPEFLLQTRPIKVARDLYPGYMFSRLDGGLDLVTATERAVELYQAAVGTGEPRHPPANFADRVRDLHTAFSMQAQLASQFPGPEPHAKLPSEFSGPEHEVLDTPVVRVDSVFDITPTTEWAGRGKASSRLLSSRDAVQERCLIRGGFGNQLIELSDRAGALLPAWPDAPYPVLLEDVAAWRRSQDKAAEVGAGNWFGLAEDGSQVQFPADQVADQVRSSMWSPSRAGLITDDRGNVERWIGFVLGILKEREPESLEITIHPEGHPAMMPGWNAVMRLRGMNMFAASARVIELAGWLPTPAPPAASSEPSGSSGSSGKVKGKSVEARMILEISKNADSLEWSARQWSLRLKCSAGTVKGTALWKDRIMPVRAAARADRAMRRRGGQ